MKAVLYACACLVVSAIAPAVKGDDMMIEVSTMKSNSLTCIQSHSITFVLLQ